MSDVHCERQEFIQQQDNPKQADKQTAKRFFCTDCGADIEVLQVLRLFKYVQNHTSKNCTELFRAVMS